MLTNLYKLCNYNVKFFIFLLCCVDLVYRSMRAILFFLSFTRKKKTTFYYGDEQTNIIAPAAVEAFPPL